MDPVELLLHPVRLRIVHALSGGRIITTSELCERIADVSKATVYRQVSVLADAGILEVDGEHRVRGFVERSYRLRRDRATIDAERAASATPDQHRQAFSVAMAALIAEFNAYLDRDTADPAADLVGYRQHAIWLSPAERAALIDDLRAALLPRLGFQPAPGRIQHLVSPILFPVESPADIPADIPAGSSVAFPAGSRAGSRAGSPAGSSVAFPADSRAGSPAGSSVAAGEST